MVIALCLCCSLCVSWGRSLQAIWRRCFYIVIAAGWAPLETMLQAQHSNYFHSYAYVFYVHEGRMRLDAIAKLLVKTSAWNLRCLDCIYNELEIMT